MNWAALPTSAHYILTKKLRGKAMWLVNSVWGKVQREEAYTIVTHNSSFFHSLALSFNIDIQAAIGLRDHILEKVFAKGNRGSVSWLFVYASRQ